MSRIYSSEAYANAFAQENDTVYLSELDTWAIVRNIPGTIYFDAIGAYPFAHPVLPKSLEQYQEALKKRSIISFVTVTDAIQGDSDWVSNVFDYARPYKPHFLIKAPATPRFSKHHRYEIRKAQLHCETKVISLADNLDDWCRLYENLIIKHSLQGLHRFSRTYFEKLSCIPEFIAVGATIAGSLVSCHLWLKEGRNVYSHLAASSQEGYASGAAYAVIDYSVKLFSDCEIIDLGGVPDKNEESDGLARFKKGFADDTRSNWICGTIVERNIYDKLCQTAGIDKETASHFPAYRR